MDKANIVNIFTEVVNQLRNTECSQKEKIACFQRIHDCIVSPAMAAQLNYANHISRATNVLLLFCEDLDPVVRMSAEENLNKIFRVLERSRVSRILMDLYGEIKRNGNQRSLRVCLRIFAYYTPQIREHHLRWYAEHLLPCLQAIAKRSEAPLQETLTEFMVTCGNNVQQGLTDSETCKLFETFASNISSDCAVKRRCSAQNCISLIENACNKDLMAKYALNKVYEILSSDQQNNTIIGALGFVRQLVPLALKILLDQNGLNCEDTRSINNSKENMHSLQLIQILEIFDYCLHCISCTPLYNHSIINVSLETINVILQSLNGMDAGVYNQSENLSFHLKELFTNHHLQHVVYLKDKKSLKNHILNLQLYNAEEEESEICESPVKATGQNNSEGEHFINGPNLKIGRLREGNLSDCITSHLSPACSQTRQPQIREESEGKQQPVGVQHSVKMGAACSMGECVTSTCIDVQQQQQQQQQTDIDNGDDDYGDDHFSRVSEMNETSQRTYSSLLTNIDSITTTTAVCNVNSNSHMLAATTTTCASISSSTTTTTTATELEEETHSQNFLLVNFSNETEKSNQLSNIDNESVNSIEFKTEISRGLVVDGMPETITVATAAAVVDDNSNGKLSATTTEGSGHDRKSDCKGNNNNGTSDAFSTFFSNINMAATESVSKLFRVSSAQSKKLVTSNTTADNNSINSSIDDMKHMDFDIEIVDAVTPSSPDASKTFATPSAAFVGDICSIDSIDESMNKMAVEGDKREIDPLRRSIRNPFLMSGSPVKESYMFREAELPMDIGTPYDQSLLYYAARLISRRFLLTGCQNGLSNDSAIRVSIKSISLSVLAQCARLAPEILQMPLKFRPNKKLENPLIKQDENLSRVSESSKHIACEITSSLSQEFDNVELTSDSVAKANNNKNPINIFDFIRKSSISSQLSDLGKAEVLEEPLLEIKDDHFGKSSTDFNYTSNLMTQSADTVLLNAAEGSLHLSKQSNLLSLSETSTPPPKPPKRMKSLRKARILKNVKTKEKSDVSKVLPDNSQVLTDVLLYYNHEDPILRASVQNIIGNFLFACQAGLTLDLQINLQHLLAIVCAGLEDEIHTVVIQALTTFDKIFPYVLVKYSTTASKLPCPYIHGTPSEGKNKNSIKQQQQQQQSNDKQNREKVASYSAGCENPNATTQTQIPTSTTTTLITNNHQEEMANSYCCGRCHSVFFRGVSSETMQLPDASSLSSASGATIESGQKTISTACRHFVDNDEIIANLLNAFQLQSKLHNNNNNNDNDNDNDEKRTTVSAACGDDDILNDTNNTNHNNFDKFKDEQKLFVGSIPSSSLPSPTSACCYCCCSLYFITPQLLLNKLRLCYYNKYWLVQNKYAEVISNLNFAPLLAYCGNSSHKCCPNNFDFNASDSFCCYQFITSDSNATDFINDLKTSFMMELLQLIGDDDVRVREQAAKCLCRLIVQNAKQDKLHSHHGNNATNIKGNTVDRTYDDADDDDGGGGVDDSSGTAAYYNNFRLLGNFLSYSIFNDMSPALAYLYNDFSTTATAMVGNIVLHKGRLNDELARVLYQITNKLLNLKDKNVQFGLVYVIKVLLENFHLADYAQVWSEYNFAEIVAKLLQHNYTTAVDLTCQSDLIDVSSKLIVGFLALKPDAQQYRDLVVQLLKHCLKIINMYYHVFSNQSPVTVTKGQKMDLFSNTKELAAPQNLGYFANDYIYIKLYHNIKSAYDNYRITINEEAGSKLISLLKSSLNSLNACIELLPHADVNNMDLVGGGGGGGGSVGDSNGTSNNLRNVVVLGGNVTSGIAKNSPDSNAVLPVASPTEPTKTTTTTTTTTTTDTISATCTNSMCLVVPALKLIEETLQYLTRIINYVPEECIACLRQLLKYLFARNYGNKQTKRKHKQQQQQQQEDRQCHYPTFTKSYFRAKTKGLQCIIREDGTKDRQRAAVVITAACSLKTKTKTSPPPIARRPLTMSQQPSPVLMGLVTTTSTTSTPPLSAACSLPVTLDSVGALEGNKKNKNQNTNRNASDYLFLLDLFVSGFEFRTCLPDQKTTLAKHIKLFEPLVVYCLTLFLKCNGKVQAAILELLILLLNLNVNYTILDSKNIIFEHIFKSLDNIESGIARNSLLVIGPMIQFLFKLSSKSECNMITVPKIISIINNLLANSSIRVTAVRALNVLAYEIFLMNSIKSEKEQEEQQQLQRETCSYSSLINSSFANVGSKKGGNSLSFVLANVLSSSSSFQPNNELDTQKEVVLGMLEKFIESVDCQRILSLLLLIEQLRQQHQQQQQQSPNPAPTNTTSVNVKGAIIEGQHLSMTTAAMMRSICCLPNPDSVCGMMCHAICAKRLCIRDWHELHSANAFFHNNVKHLLSNSKDFMALLTHLLDMNVANFSDLSYATIILSNVILKTEEIYLVNHIKLHLKNHPRIAKNLQEKLLSLTTTTTLTTNSDSKDHHSTVLRWPLLDIDNDKPTTSSAAAAVNAVAVAAAAATSEYNIKEMQYFAIVLCESLEKCLSIISDWQMSATAPATVTRQFAMQYTSLVAYFVETLYELCYKSRLECVLWHGVRNILTAAESKTLNIFYKLLALNVCTGTPTSCPFSATDTSTMSSPSTTLCQWPTLVYHEFDHVVDVVLLLQIKLFELLYALKLLEPVTLLQRLQRPDISHTVRRSLLQQVCRHYDANPIDWYSLKLQQHLMNERFLNILIIDEFAFMCSLCKADEESCSLFQRVVLDNISTLTKPAIVCLLRLMDSYCKETDCSVRCIVKYLQILCKLHQNVTRPKATVRAYDRTLQVKIERLTKRLVNTSPTFIRNKTVISTTFKHLIKDVKGEEGEDEPRRISVPEATCQSVPLHFLILNDLENCRESGEETDGDVLLPLGDIPNVVDEKWIFNQLTKLSMQSSFYTSEQIVNILLQIQSENKLHNIFNNGNFDVARILRHAIASSLEAMLTSFRKNCVQHNPHIHYLQLNPLARVSVAALMTRINHLFDEQPLQQNNNNKTLATVVFSRPSKCEYAVGEKIIISTAVDEEHMYLTEALLALMDGINCIEMTALIYVEWKFVEKFVKEHLLPPDTIITMLRFMQWSCNRLQNLLACPSNNVASPLTPQQKNNISAIVRCLAAMLRQKPIWCALTQADTDGNFKKAATSAGGDTFYSCNVAAGLKKCEQNIIICSLLDVAVRAAISLLENTIFYKKYKNNLELEAFSIPLNAQQHQQNYENEQWLAAAYTTKAVFLAKLIETEIGQLHSTSAAQADTHIAGVHNNIEFVDLNYYHVDYIPWRELLSIGISTLRTHLFYAVAVTPHEIMQHCLPNHKRTTYAALPSPLKEAPTYDSGCGCVEGGGEVTSANFKPILFSTSSLPSIPIESLSDVDILRSFVKRSSIFGFTTRQQFEEYFMTFLLLINNAYEENMVDEQEQFQIRRICLEAIMELLITYKTFPIVGNKVSSQYHHTTRWHRINCDSISLKKLHEIQLIISGANVYYHPNLERNLLADTVIGSHAFATNQYDLNFIWQQMDSHNKESNATSTEAKGVNVVLELISRGRGFTMDKSDCPPKYMGDAAANIMFQNFQYFTRLSGIDYKSSSQVLFDVLMQMLEQNYILILPILIQFVEICENREQVKQIYEKAHFMQAHTPMDDTITHQYLIYLLCKTSAMLIPTMAEVLQLEHWLKSYLKSSHVFIRCMSLSGLISLLECCSKTSPAIGKLSDELILLKILSLTYIDKYNGIAQENPLQCSDWHTKLLWTLNYCIVEWTCKLDPVCCVPAHIKLAAGKLLKSTNNAEVYLCVLHGLERMIVLGHKNCDWVDGQNQMLSGVEKLALELAKRENEKFSIPALKLLLSCIYMGSTKQLENTELSNGVVQDEPEIIAQQIDKIDILLQCIKTATRETAWIYGRVLCQIIRDLVPPKEILTKVIKELLAINQQHSNVVAMIVFQVFRSAIDSSFLQQLQDWLSCSLPTFLALPQPKAVWSLTVVFLSASINLHLMKLFPLVLNNKDKGIGRQIATVANASVCATSGIDAGLLGVGEEGGAGDEFIVNLGHHEIVLFMTSAQDFYAKLNHEQKQRFRLAFQEFHHIQVYNKMLQSL